MTLGDLTELLVENGIQVCGNNDVDLLMMDGRPVTNIAIKGNCIYLGDQNPEDEDFKEATIL